MSFETITFADELVANCWNGCV